MISYNYGSPGLLLGACAPRAWLGAAKGSTIRAFISPSEDDHIAYKEVRKVLNTQQH